MSYFDSFQVAAMIVFLIVFLGRTLYLRFRKHINPMTLGVGKKGLRQIVEFTFFAGLLVWILEVLFYALNAPFRIFPPPLDAQLVNSLPVKVIVIALITISFIIFIWSLISFRDAWRVGIDKKTPGDLVTTGIFSVTRNPIFIFVDLYFVGTFLVNGTLIFLIFAVVVVIGLHYQMILEETHLKAAYGKAYQTYCAKTGRYVGQRRISDSG